MKALSMMQPYAWLFAHGYLTIDDRAWPTYYRGLVALHASKRFHFEYYCFLRMHTDWQLPEIGGFDHGGIVGVANLVDCLQPDFPKGAPLRTLDLRRSHFGAPGHFGLVFTSPRVLPLTPFRGNTGLFELPDWFSLP